MTAPPTVLCADIGTSSLKAACIDLDGHTRCFARETYGAPGSALPVIALEWENALARALAKLLSRDDVCRPDAICISGNGPTLTPVARNGETLAPLYWHQGPQGSAESRGEAGGRSFFLPHVERFRRERPEDYERTALLLPAQEWLSWRLGAEAAAALPPAYEPYYWDDAQCGALGIDRGLFPSFVAPGTVIGRLSAAAARRLSDLAGGPGRLNPGTPIVAGGVDFIMALIGAGTVELGMVCDRAGSSEGINLCAAFPGRADPPRFPPEIRVLPHAGAGLWNLSVIIPASGSLFERYRALAGQERRPYDDILAELIPAGLLPDISPAGGFSGAVELGRAALTAMGFAVRAAADTLSRHGFPVTEMRLSGGQSKNRRWNQLKADLTGISLLVPEQPDCELAGDAVLGAIALGEAADIKEGISRIVRVKERIVPDPAAVAAYAGRFQARLETREKIEKALSGDKIRR
ncbi:MAG: sugar kinase [Treponema sp.]|jgi:sugar (pentulose or hexulose) kinase|nr:sugar kinase [Treponema sp.]